jgi:basic membrane protein A and related proteins
MAGLFKKFCGIASIIAIAVLSGGSPGLVTSASAEALKIGILLPGSVTDGGYNADGGHAAEALRSVLKADVKVTEGVPIANQADVYRQFATGGYTLVIGWGGQFTDGAVQVAEEFPNTKFLVVNAVAENGKNLASLDTKVEHWQYLAGYVTAKLSKSGVIGWVGGQCFPATAANLHAVEQGAKAANPNIKVIGTFTGDFEDPIKAQQTAQAMIDTGKADALTANLNSGFFGVFKAAQSNGKVKVVTEWMDNRELAPTVIASSILKAQAPFIVEVSKAVADGTFQGKHYEFGLTKDWGPVMTKTDLLPEDIYKSALAVQDDIVSGKVMPVHDTACPK